VGPSNPDEPLQSAGPAPDRGYLSAAGFVLRQAQSSPLGGAKANHYSARPDSFPPARSCDQHHRPPAPNCYKRNPLRHQQEAVTAPPLVQLPVVAGPTTARSVRCPLCEVNTGVSGCTTRTVWPTPATATRCSRPSSVTYPISKPPTPNGSGARPTGHRDPKAASGDSGPVCAAVSCAAVAAPGPCPGGGAAIGPSPNAG